MKIEEIHDLEREKHDCLLNILKYYKKANAGHIGSTLSCLDILVFIFFRVMKLDDHFVLSKGHAALGLYAVLAAKGKIAAADIESFYEEGTNFAAHPPCNGYLSCIPFGTGSLGHGLSLATGIALSYRFSGENRNVYCLLSDGDCNEGSTWEAAMFASHHKLKNLIVIIDNNDLQGFGRTSDVLNMGSLKKKWESFNFDVYYAPSGNDFKCLDNVFESINFDDLRPKCIIAKTVKGSGVPFMEDKLEWHYLPMDDDQYSIAIENIKS